MLVEEYLRILSPEDLAEIESVPIEDRLKVNNTFEMFSQAFDANPEKLALRFLPTGSVDDAPVDFTYAEMRRKTMQTANLFHSLGVRPGKAVAYLLPNIPETYFCLVGGEAAGIVCAINYFLEAEHIAALVLHSGAEVLVVQGPSDFPIWEKLATIRAQVPGLKTVLRVGEGPDVDDTGAQVLDFAAELKKQPDDHLLGKPGNQNEVAAYFHTGGTTGVPKITPLTHLNELSATWSCLQMFAMKPDDVILCATPTFHAGGIKVGCMFPLAAGATVVLAGPAGFRNPKIIREFWRLTEKYRVTYVPGLPTVFAGILDVPVDADISSLDFLQISGAASPAELFRRFYKATGLHLYEAYGLTEATLVTHGNPRGVAPRHGSAGFRIPYVHEKIFALGKGQEMARECAQGEMGLTAVKGPTVFSGYLNLRSDKGPWLGEGWLNTGDIGRIDEDGYLWITGRQKDMINRAGHNIDPDIIEGPIHEHPAVAQCAAVAKPDAYAGELPIAYVKLVDGAHATPEEILDFARARITERAAVPKELIIVDAMPLTSVGKIDKKPLRERATTAVILGVLSKLGLAEDRYRVRMVMDPEKGALAIIELDQTSARATQLNEKIEDALSEFTFPFRIDQMASSD